MNECQLFQTEPRELIPLDAGKAKDDFDELSEKLIQLGNADLLKKITITPGLQSFLEAVFNLSPFLRDCSAMDPEMFADISSRPFEETMQQTLGRVCVAGIEAR